MQQEILGLTLEELQTQFVNLGLKKYRARQVFEWLYAKSALSFEEMTNLSKADRFSLEINYSILTSKVKVLRELNSDDGLTNKVLLQFPDGAAVETVLMHHGRDSGVGEETQVLSKTAIIHSLNTNTPEQQQKPEPKANKGKKYTALFVAALVFLSAIIYGVIEYTKASIIVPDLKGKTVVQAEEILTKLKLTYSLAEEFNAEVKSGQVCRQNPPAKSRVKEGRKILVVISKGAEPGVVPDVTKKNLGEATVMLHNAQLEVGRVTVKYDKQAPQGSVLSQGTPSGTKLNPGTKVDLIVNISEGQTVVPSLEGLTLSDARSTLASLGLSLGRINKVNSKEKADTVLDADTQAGKIVEKGTTINVNVSQGEDKKTKDDKDKAKTDDKNKTTGTQQSSTTETPTEAKVEKTVEFVVPAGKGKRAVKITLSDANSTRVIYTGNVDGGARVRQSVTVGNDTSVQFYVDDRLVEDRRL